MFNVVTNKKKDENSNALLRRFSKKMRASGSIMAVKHNRYHERKMSPVVRKKECLNKLKRRGEFEENYRLGKVTSLFPNSNQK